MDFLQCVWCLSLTTLGGILDGIFCALNDLLGIAQPLFCFAGDLLVDALGLLHFVAKVFSGFLLDFASEVFHSAFDLILVHGGSPLKVSEWFRKKVN